MTPVKLYVFALAAVLAAGCSNAFAQDLRIGLRADPSSLDPALSGSFVDRIVLQSACDKLVDIDPQGNIIPMLSTSWTWSDGGTALTMKLRPGIKYQDGQPFDAASVQFNINRYKTMKGSRRAAELSNIKAVDVVDDNTVKLTLNAPSVSLLALFTDRDGMMVSQKAVEAATPDSFSRNPVCVGPYAVSKDIPQQEVVLKKSNDYWNAAKFHFDSVTFVPMPDSNVRVVNLRSGQLDLVENVPPSEIENLAKIPAFKTSVGAQPAFLLVMFNLKGPGANPDFAKNAALRRAFSMALDRGALNDVVFSGRYAAGNQPFPPGSTWYDSSLPAKRDVAGAKALLAQAGIPSPTLDLMVDTDSERQLTAQVMQSMLADVGIKMNIVTRESVTQIAETMSGKFQAEMASSAGRIDPDLNISLFIACGVPNNVGQYCNPDLDKLLTLGRAESDQTKRKAIYDQAMSIIMNDAPIVYLLNPSGVFAMTSKLQGFTPYPDGVIRLQDVTFSK